MFVSEKKFLPWSARRFSVDGVGKIYDSKNCEIKTTLKQGVRYVELEWVNGKKKYPVALVVLVCFNKLGLPEHLYSEVEPLFKDGNTENLSPGNLLYKFKPGKLEVEGYPGYYYVPFFVKYAINEEGLLLNIETGKVKVWSVTSVNGDKNQTGGYIYCHAINDSGSSKTLFKHRALCFTFKDYNSDIEDLVINHIDGDPTNNRLNNLEITTYLENNLHALNTGLRGDNKPVLSKNLVTGEIMWFRSQGECGKFYGQTRAGFLQHRLKHAKDKVYPDMLLFKYDDGTQWPEINLEEVEITRSGGLWDIQAKNVFTGDIVIFTGAAAGLEYTGVEKQTIIAHMLKESVIPINGWIFRWHSNYSNIAWPTFTEKHLLIFSKYPMNPPDGVILKNIRTGEEIFFESVEIACKSLDTKKHTIYTHAKTGKIFNEKYKVELFKIRENIGPTVG